MGVWDGLDECEISRPEILSQSAPDKNECILNLYSEDSVYLYILFIQYNIYYSVL